MSAVNHILNDISVRIQYNKNLSWSQANAEAPTRNIVISATLTIMPEPGMGLATNPTQNVA